jgi:uncharacterized membrane protein
MPGNPLTDPNWATETTDTVVRVVGNVREKTTVPAVHAARAVVFGILAAFIGLAALVLFLIMVQRAVEALWDLGVSEEQAVYLSQLTIGGILCLVGLLLFAKRKSAG